MLFQGAARPRSFISFFRHFGLIGLFLLCILDSSPIPGFGGPDILVAILVATRHNSWYACALVASAGATIGSFLTFRLARKAGEAWLHSKFGRNRVARFLTVVKERGTVTLIAVTAIPFPLPTSVVIAAAGASEYPLGKFVVVVGGSRIVRYAAIGLLVDRYGRQIIRMFRHPTQYVGWLLLLGALTAVLIAAGILVHRRLIESPAH